MRFVQIGTSSAKDDVFDFIKDQDIDLGVLVEPLEDHRQEILDCYEGIENIHLEQVAVRWDEIKEVQFYSSELHPGASSFRKSHLLKHRVPMDKIDTRVVKCIHIHELFDKYNIDYLDHLFTDTEGFDGVLLLCLDFNKYKIQHIVFESVHLDSPMSSGGEKTKKVLNHLVSNGYKVKKSKWKFNMEATLDE